MNAPAELSHQRPLEATVVVVGVGLIGGSIAGACRQRGVAHRVIGVGRNPARLAAAQDAGLLDGYETELRRAVLPGSLVVFATPVAEITAAVLALRHHLTSDTVITDAGSVKANVCAGCASIPQFIGAHPIAGKETAGFEHADPGLFVDRMCVVTPQADASPERVSRIERFWRGLGMQVARMTPEEHDLALARTSHVPHAVAAAVAAAGLDGDRPFLGTGFRSTTRIAAGPADLWTGIFAANAPAVLAGLERITAELATFRSRLEASDWPALRDWLERARLFRERVDDTKPAPEHDGESDKQ